MKNSYITWLCKGLQEGWMGRGDRYTLEDQYGKEYYPDKVRAGLIPMSFNAEKKLKDLGLKRKNSYGFYTKLGLRYEHRVPLSKIKLLIAECDFDPFRTEKILEDYFQVVWITNEEDEFLKECGLNSRMPEGWKVGDDPDARYQKAGIQVNYKKGKKCGSTGKGRCGTGCKKCPV
tara:strand:- start:279 stop:803 length:525 start_codon:yes stop_codon:yes gene_type:complete